MRDCEIHRKWSFSGISGLGCLTFLFEGRGNRPCHIYLKVTVSLILMNEMVHRVNWCRICRCDSSILSAQLKSFLLQLLSSILKPALTFDPTLMYLLPLQRTYTIKWRYYISSNTRTSCSLNFPKTQIKGNQQWTLMHVNEPLSHNIASSTPNRICQWAINYSPSSVTVRKLISESGIHHIACGRAVHNIPFMFMLVEKQWLLNSGGGATGENV